jgi:hypothetical protein
MTRGTRKTGDFCCINIVTPQLNEAMAFFSEPYSYISITLSLEGRRHLTRSTCCPTPSRHGEPSSTHVN